MGSAQTPSGSPKGSMLLLFTDYGWQDPYVGQVKAVMAAEAPGVPVIDLLHAVPDYNAHAGALLLAAMAPAFPVDSVFFCIVDPGVGSERAALVIEADGRWFIGPDNGLLSIVAARASRFRAWHIRWKPEGLTASFHGRDLFAPIAAWIAAGQFPVDKLVLIAEPNIQFDSADLPRILYIDHFGNAWTGIRGGLADATSRLEVKGKQLPWRRVFSEAGKGELFWYQNSCGLIEIAANRGNAAAFLELKVGDLVRLSSANQKLPH